MGTVYLVGAGPGDPELITVKGQRLLRQADVLIYDSLAPQQLTDLVKEDCQLICVGKRAGRHSASQEEINRLLIEKAGEYQSVVRLKGGDPYVFGRGGEEVLALKNAGVSFEVIPGVSAAVAVPAEAGIPVTHRGMARSFHVITGHTADEEPDYGAWAKAEGTLVFLMGLSAIDRIAAGLMEGGKDPRTPAAVISGGFSEQEKVLRAPLEQIAQLSRAEAMAAPAVIVVGDTAALDLRDSSPLIGVTATDSFYRRLADAMGEQACLLRQEMRIRLRLLAEGEKDVLDCLGRLQDFDLIAFTSANAVRIVQDIAKKEGIDLRHLPAARFAAIGPGTQAAIRDAFGGGGQAAVQVLVPDCYDSRDLARKIVQDISGRRVWMIRSAVGDPEMNAILDRGGISYHLTRLYRTEGELLADAQQLKRTGIHVFASASGVSCMFSAAEKEELDLHGTACACIGEATAARLRAWGLEPLFTASPHTAQELARWLKEYIKKGRS